MAAKLEEFRINLVGSKGGSDLLLVREPNSLNVQGRWKQWPSRFNSYHNGPITGQEGDYQMWARYVEDDETKRKEMVTLIKRAVLMLQQIPLVNEEGTVQERDTSNDPVPTKYIYPDGTPTPTNICVMPDHYLTTFSVTVRTQFPVYPNGLKDTIETKCEVVAVKMADETCVVRNSK